MARRPHREEPTDERSDRERIIEAFRALAAERPFSEIGLTDIAARAGLTLGRVRAEFNSVISILAAHMEEIDRQVLDGTDDADMAEETPREKLFDVLMRRFETLAPHKAAIRSIVRAARCNPPLGLALNGLTVRSMQWMLEAAGISTSGLRGGIRAQGLACIYADVLRTWLDDDDPGLARTMAALDRGLARGQRWSNCLDDLVACLPNPCRSRRWRPRERRSSDPGEQPAVV
jgi:AcrR family transcriptional regulator